MTYKELYTLLGARLVAPRAGQELYTYYLCSINQTQGFINKYTFSCVCPLCAGIPGQVYEGNDTICPTVEAVIRLDLPAQKRLGSSYYYHMYVDERAATTLRLWEKFKDSMSFWEFYGKLEK